MNDRNLTQTSLALNALLVAVCLGLLWHQQTAAVTPGAPGGPALVRQEKAAPPGPPRPPPPRRQGWVDALRENGIPEKVLIRLVLADFDDRWQARQSDAQEAYNRGDMDSDGLAALGLEHDIEQENALRSAMGEDSYRRWDQERLFQQFNLKNLNLTGGETNALYALAVHWRQRQRELNEAKRQNQIDQATLNEEQGKAQTDFEQQARALLGDQRYKALHGTDPTVGELRRGLRSQQLNEEQFAILLLAQQQWETNRSQLEQQAVETGKTGADPQIQTITASRDQVFENILGTNEFVHFTRQQDSRYLEMQKNAVRWGLDAAGIDYVYSQIQSYELTAKELTRQTHDLEVQGSNVDWDAFDQHLQACARQLAGNLQTNLGDARYGAIYRNQLLPFAMQ